MEILYKDNINLSLDSSRNLRQRAYSNVKRAILENNLFSIGAWDPFNAARENSELMITNMNCSWGGGGGGEIGG